MKSPLSPELQEFNRIYKELDDIYHHLAKSMRLSDSAFTILYSIFSLGDGCLQRDICNTAFISKQTVNSSVRKLEQEGFLCLTRGKGKDMHLHLTPQGKTLVQEKILPVIQIENQAFAQMSSEEISQFLHLTRKYVALLKDGSISLERSLK